MIETIIPFAGGCPSRRVALDHVIAQWPWPVTVAETTVTPWAKAAAVNPAVQRSRAEVLVIADADVICESRQAIEAVAAGAAWAIPHGTVYRLTREGTRNMLAGEPWDRQPLDQPAYLGIEGGGIVIARRETLLDVPLDPRFHGWGQEDESWAIALRTLAGAPWRGHEPLVHLWHPPQQRLSRRRGSEASWRLRRRYLKARHDPATMRALLEEACVHHQPAHQDLHDHQPVGL